MLLATGIGILMQFSNELNDIYQKEVNPFRSLKLHYDEKASGGKFDYAYQRARDLYEENEPFVIADPCVPFVSNTYSEKGPELDQMINDASIQYVMGAIDENKFNEVINQWRQSGGDDVIAEYTEEYQKIQK